MSIPVILDTDIGGDIDDTWALAMLLRCPELDLKLVTTATGDTTYRAKIVARLLEIDNATHVPIGIGPLTSDRRRHPLRQESWVAAYDLSTYAGQVHEDGVAALIDTVMSSPEPITLIAIGPLTTVAAALEREPRIAERCRFVGMHGSIEQAHEGRAGAIAEYNVVQDVPAAQAVFEAGWPITITPLDSCGRVRLTGERYARIAASSDTLLTAVLENYRIWEQSGGMSTNSDTQSSILFDTVAVYLAFADDLLQMKQLNITVTEDGYTRQDPAGKDTACAVGWQDEDAFLDLLTERLLGNG